MFSFLSKFHDGKFFFCSCCLPLVLLLFLKTSNQIIIIVDKNLRFFSFFWDPFGHKKPIQMMMMSRIEEEEKNQNKRERERERDLKELSNRLCICFSSVSSTKHNSAELLHRISFFTFVVVVDVAVIIVIVLFAHLSLSLCSALLSHTEIEFSINSIFLRIFFLLK